MLAVETVQTRPDFQKDEIVRAHHKGQLYDATIVEVRQDPDGQYKYKIHYKRWNKRLDEFVPASRIVKAEPESSISQEYGPVISEQRDGIISELAKKDVDAVKLVIKESQSEVPAARVTPVTEKKGKGKQDTTRKLIERKADCNCATNDFKVTFPVKLLAFLQQQQKTLSSSSNGRLLMELPWQSKRPTVSMILDSFLDSHNDHSTSELSGGRKKEHPPTPSGVLPSYSMLKVAMTMIAQHFDKMLPVMLLYPLEWPQYVTLCKTGSRASCGSTKSHDVTATLHQDKQPADIYGAEHLLRMLYMLPSLLTVPYSGKKEEESQLQVQEVHSSTIQTALRDYALIFNNIVSFIADQMELMLPPMSVDTDTSDDVLLSIAASDAQHPVSSAVPIPVPVPALTVENVQMEKEVSMATKSVTFPSPVLESNKISKSCVLKTTALDSKRVSFAAPVSISVPLVIPEHHAVVSANEVGASNMVVTSTVTAITAEHTDLHIEVHSEDDDIGSINSDQPEKDEDDNGDASEKRKQMAIEQSRMKIIACPASWECTKCSSLNSHRARSCESCGEKKLPIQFTKVKAHSGRGRGRPRVIINGTGVEAPKKSHKKIVKAVM